MKGHTRSREIAATEQEIYACPSEFETRYIQPLHITFYKLFHVRNTTRRYLSSGVINVSFPCIVT